MMQGYKNLKSKYLNVYANANIRSAVHLATFTLTHASYPTRKTVPLMEFINKFFNSISAMLSLPSATLPLTLFKILPLPSTSRAALDRPAKINKPIVK